MIEIEVLCMLVNYDLINHIKELKMEQLQFLLNDILWSLLQNGCTK